MFLFLFFFNYGSFCSVENVRNPFWDGKSIYLAKHTQVTKKRNLSSSTAPAWCDVIFQKLFATGKKQMLERTVTDIDFKLNTFAFRSPSDGTRMSITSPVVYTQSLYSQRYKASLLHKSSSHSPVWGEIHWFSEYFFVLLDF